jgi:hypothetical protein
LQLVPNAHHVVLVSGASAFDARLVGTFTSTLKRPGDRSTWCPFPGYLSKRS